MVLGREDEVSTKSADRVRIAELLSTYSVTFSAGFGPELDAILEKESLIWSSLCQVLIKETQDTIGGRSGMTVVASAIQSRIMNFPAKTESLFEEGAKIVSSYPYILHEQLTELHELAKSNPWFMSAFIVDRFADTIVRNFYRPEDQQTYILFVADPRMASAIAEVQVAQESEKLSRETNAIGRRTFEALGELRTGEESRNEEFQKLIASNMAAMNERSATFETFLDEAKQSITAARRQATEAGVLLHATRLWARKAILHGAGFWFGLAVMAGVICTSLYLAYWHAPAFLAALPKKPDGEVTYVTVALLTICAIAAGWLLRFIGRFVTENMVLQTDADQRRVMLQTYLALVGDKDARMEQADRTLILNAVFRPLPGHQSEDVAPPTLLDLAKSAVPGGDKK